MIGIPKVCQTADDWVVAVGYAIEHDTGKGELKARLENLRDNQFKLVLKKESEGKPPEEQTPDDYEKVLDPAAEKNRLGVDDEWINSLIAQLDGTQEEKQGGKKNV